MRPVAENVRVAGLYSSVLAVLPPATSTLPSRKRVAVWPDRAASMGPVATQVFGGPRDCPVAAAAPAPSAASPEVAAKIAVAIAANRLRPARGDDVTVSSYQANSSQLTVSDEVENGRRVVAV